MAKTATPSYKINDRDSNLYIRARVWAGQACRVFMPLGQNIREINTRVDDFYPGGVDGFIIDFNNNDLKSAR